jgi:hypothetical protein
VIATLTPASDLSELRSAVFVAASLGALGLLLVIASVALNDFFTVAATLSFAASGNAERLRRFVLWQIVGGVFGLGINVTFAGLVRYWSLTFANACGSALAFLSAQVFANQHDAHEHERRPQPLRPGKGLAEHQVGARAPLRASCPIRLGPRRASTSSAIFRVVPSRIAGDGVRVGT